MKEGKKSREYGKNMPSWLKALLFAIIGTLLVIGLKECVTGSSKKANASVLETRRQNEMWNQIMIDSCIDLLKDGDLVVRTGKDVTSQMFRKFNKEDQTYSHCGIVAIENGYPFVYHSIGGEDNPDAKLRRDSAIFWFSTKYNLGLGIYRYDFGDEELLKLRDVVRKYYKERRMFDMKFDLQTEDRLYCAEFVYKTINHATGNRGYLNSINVLGYEFVPVDILYLNEHARFICQIRYK